MTKCMQGIGYVEPYQVASTGIMSKRMPRIGYVDQRLFVLSISKTWWFPKKIIISEIKYML